MPRRVEVAFEVPREVAFDYLADPRNRTQWQPSLRSVEVLDSGPLQAGTRWRERAVGGVVSQMWLTALERPVLWAESGMWRGISANLSLSFDEAPSGCLATARMALFGSRAWRPLVAVLNRVAPYVVRRDLERAARILAGRSP